MSAALLANIGLIILLLYSLIQFALTAHTIEDDRRVRERRLGRLEEELGHATAAANDAKATAEGSAREVAGLEEAVATLRATRAEADAKLRELQSAPRRRLIVPDKTVLVHGRLWEVTVVPAANSVAANTDGADAASVIEGAQVYLFGATTDRDARFRAEQRFPTSLGYRVQKVERFKRG
ncbi:hypothetical protein [Nitrospirillum viridazoti]|uniref:Uncharacterized protein n=1 Tax=Nitrospirillum viridazoti CBAmc TaxID=1441467 RepID=A0A248JLY2_9PROT|nr:hypothetical protein [Nitrospirillum amazonense]ASG19743.1 hypothetical protein Y958_02055 [Nitrospirillum amazonense CBAmc]TWB26833.1 hypothetical protein FBZ91_13632 [Nitrospirillum amazonense]